MAKDPAFLFYPGDWMGGVIKFSRAHKGAYMDLLMAQYNDGHMDIEDIKIILGSDFDMMWESKLKSKFIQDSKGLYFNKKLDEVIEKRRAFSESRQNNLKSKKSHKKPHKDNHMVRHMEFHAENENEDINKNIIEGEKRIYSALKKEFENYYLKVKGIAYYFQGGKDGSALKQIITKIKSYCGNNEDLILQSWQVILEKNPDKFINDNLSISLINSKFNEIIAKIKKLDNSDFKQELISSMINEQTGKD